MPNPRSYCPTPDRCTAPNRGVCPCQVDAIAKMSASLKAAWADPEVKARHAAAWADPEVKARHAAQGHRGDDMTPARAYYNEIDPNAAAWLRELIKLGLIDE